jgi:hypothetical protein
MTVHVRQIKQERGKPTHDEQQRAHGLMMISGTVGRIKTGVHNANQLEVPQVVAIKRDRRGADLIAVRTVQFDLNRNNEVVPVVKLTAYRADQGHGLQAGDAVSVYGLVRRRFRPWEREGTVITLR